MPVVQPLMEQGGKPTETRSYQLNDFTAVASTGH